MYSPGLTVNQPQLNSRFEQSDVDHLALLTPTLAPSNHLSVENNNSGYEGYWFSLVDRCDWIIGSDDVCFVGQGQYLNPMSLLSTTPGLGIFFKAQETCQWNSINKQINCGSANVRYKDEGIPVT